MNVVKKAARRTIRVLKRMMGEPPVDPVELEARRHANSAYQLLNRLLLQMVGASKGEMRPNYTWGVLHAAHLGRALGHKRISVIEFGVAGGNGLISLEKTASAVEQALGIAIEVYGFDTGEGLPQPQDCRDMPNIFFAEALKMDFQQLRTRLQRAELILGDVRETLRPFLDKGPAPVGFMSIDVDLYVSTVNTLKLLEADANLLLPRIHCYFDDIMGWTYGDYNGERLAIAEFNASHDRRKLSPIYGLAHFVPLPFARDIWTQQMYFAHLFDHPAYSSNDGLVLAEKDEGVHALRPDPALLSRPC